MTWSINTLFCDGVRIWDPSCGADGEDLLVAVSGEHGFTSVETLAGQARDYHLYELIYDPHTQQADLWVDGQRRIAAYPGRPRGDAWPQEAWIQFGSADGYGRGHWSLVEFEVH